MLTDSSEDGRDTLGARVGILCAGGLLDAADRAYGLNRLVNVSQALVSVF
jgi:hypothetical protein